MTELETGSKTQAKFASLGRGPTEEVLLERLGSLRNGQGGPEVVLGRGPGTRLRGTRLEDLSRVHASGLLPLPFP